MKKYFYFSTIAISLAMTNINAQDVYVVGGETVVTSLQGGGTSTSWSAKIWKNGVATNLPDGSNASSVFVEGNDVYVAGYAYKLNPRNERIRVACVWKNGIRTALTGTDNKDAYAQSVFVAGNDVYVAGNEKYGNGTASIDKIDVAKVWKNGVETKLGNSVFAQSVFVVGNDVYVAGYADDGDDRNGKSQAVLWKNGVITFLTDGTNAAYANSIYVSGNDVYVAGDEFDRNDGYSVAKVWKNGIATNLPTDGTANIFAYSVFVVQNDVYVAGYQLPYPIAKYWKNGTETILPKEKSFAYAQSIFVQGEDVYVAGYERSANEKEIAKLWKNGIATSLSDGTNATIAYSVFVTDKNTGISSMMNDELKMMLSGAELRIENYTGTAVAVYDVMGRNVGARLIAPLHDGAQTLNISHLPTGIYIVKAGNYTGKFVKQ